ncbi:MAG: TonB-dependent receptor, partial [Rhizobacter sp.]|nr:TonB-dependent receptor [Ferruginibacter sp.]
KLLGGMTYNRNNSPFLAVTGEAYPNDIFRDPSQATYKSTPSASNSDKYLFQAYFGRLNYSYKQKYLLEVSYRREGSSRFGRGHKFGDFPAIGAGWIISDEAFLKNVSFIDLLKLRSSFGLTGSTGGIQNFQSYNQWKNAQSDNLGSYKGNPYFFSEQVANPDLRWEKQTQFDIGLEFKIFNNRLSGTVDFYNKVSNDLLLEFPGGATQGQENPNIVINAGSLRNRGVELSLSSVNYSTKDFNWTTDFNISHNQNKVLNVSGISPTSLSGGSSVATFIGRPIGTFNMIRWAGVDSKTGDEQIYDKDGIIRVAKTLTSTEINAARVGIFDKPATPKAVGGLTNNFSYKNFDLSILFTFSVGQWLYDEGERKSSYFTGNEINLRQSAVDRWTVDNTGSNYPKLYYNDAVNDPLRSINTTRFLHNASYARLKTIQLGYNLPEILLRKVNVNRFRVYITGQNLLTFTKFPGWDPENVRDLGGLDNAGVQARNLGQGFTEYNLPQVKTLIIGASIGF